MINCYKLYKNLVNRPPLRLPYPLVIQLGHLKLETPIHRADLQTISDIFAIETTLCYVNAIWKNNLTVSVMQLEILLVILTLYGSSMDAVDSIRAMKTAGGKMKFICEHLTMVGHMISLIIHLCHYQNMFC